MIYAALFEASSEALRALAANPKFVGTDRLGFFGVLHTWGRTWSTTRTCTMSCRGAGSTRLAVAGCPPGLTSSCRWRLCPSSSAPSSATSWRENLLHLVDPAVWRRNWVVDSQAAGDGRASLRYLAPYVFRVAIGNHRIVSCEDGIVTFTYRRVGSKRLRKMSLDAMEFLRRFLQHVLPAGFQKVRHYGFLSPNCATSIEAVRSMVTVHNRAKFVLLAERAAEPAARPVPRCPSCGGPMVLLGFVPALAPFDTS